ncbi:twin transmembrane helix small protein [Hoeflea sp. G2-23]|uniref:Twin transmembrane helix small protein n=1 Tax=Hoeflea algicola TaxID=2983763 RepID=A0ABT3ZA82_9HYPH|nr:twin transmembrane helix small protein [Hoeflea algicola]MCY0148685.1 twin transmembrane helix small protein [Hoeflea algicola]
MSSVTYALSIVVMLAVAAVLVRGLVNMARGGSSNLSNKLMQARVLLQFLAIILIVATLWLTGGGR